MQILDTLDRELIALLRRDGRAPISKLADVLGVSRGTVQNRLDRLEASGTLLGYTVRVREELEEGSVKAVMLIEVAGHSTAQIIRKLRGIPELVDLHTTNGAWDLVAQINATNLADFDRVLRIVRAIDGVMNSETCLLLSSA